MSTIVGKFVYATCSCGDHLIDLYDPVWDEKKMGFYSCNHCNAPLLARGDNGKFYYIGKEV